MDLVHWPWFSNPSAQYYGVCLGLHFGPTRNLKCLEPPMFFMCDCRKEAGGRAVERQLLKSKLPYFVAGREPEWITRAPSAACSAFLLPPISTLAGLDSLSGNSFPELYCHRTRVLPSWACPHWVVHLPLISTPSQGY